MHQRLVHAALGRAREVLGLFATPLSPADYFHIGDSSWSHEGYAARVIASQPTADSTRTLTLRASRGFPSPRSGQYVSLSVIIDGVTRTRTFSVSSAPDPQGRTFDVTVRAVAGGVVTPFLTSVLRVGDTVRVSAPAGNFVLPDDARRPLLFITAGSGVTPVMSMLRSLARERARRDAVHLHFEKSAERIIFERELTCFARENPGYRRLVTLTDSIATAAEASTRISIDVLERDCPDWRARATFASGPEPLLSTLEDTFAHQNVTSNLCVERFHPRPFSTSSDPTASAESAEVTFRTSKRTARADGKTPLLLVAENAGLVPRHGCRMGICHSCDVTLRRGAVRDLRTGNITREPGARVQVCVCAAQGNVEIDL